MYTMKNSSSLKSIFLVQNHGMAVMMGNNITLVYSEA